jgi:hypothetical protein
VRKPSASYCQAFNMDKPLSSSHRRVLKPGPQDCGMQNSVQSLPHHVAHLLHVSLHNESRPESGEFSIDSLVM